MSVVDSPTNVRPLQEKEVARIQRSCSHVHVPPAPAAWGYRFYDLGGESLPFYLRRFEAGQVAGTISLTAPVERLTGDEAEPGASAIARVSVTLGLRTLGWDEVLDPALREHGWRDVVALVLDELACLDLIPAGECPICG
jgi:hypothetical protein